MSLVRETMGILALHNIGFDLNILKADGCQLVDPPELFKGLMIATSGDPCTTGCAYFMDGKCPAYLKHHSAPKGDTGRQNNKTIAKAASPSLLGGKWKDMTSKQIRKAEGISPAEFQKRKQAGRYKH